MITYKIVKYPTLLFLGRCSCANGQLGKNLSGICVDDRNTEMLRYPQT